MLKDGPNSYFEFRDSLLSIPLDAGNENEIAIAELQEAYRKRLTRQIMKVMQDLHLLQHTNRTEETLLDMMHTLSSMASTADTYGLNRLGEYALLMLSLVKECVSKNGNLPINR